jgi:hypothetical protein
MPRGEPPFFTSNPGEKPGRQLRTRSTVPGTVSASPAVAAPSVQDADAPKSPTGEVFLQEDDRVEEELRCLRHYCRAEVPKAVEVHQEEGEQVIQEILV